MMRISRSPKSRSAKLMIGTALLLATCVVAFVRHAAHYRKQFIFMATPTSESTDLKSLLQSTDYNSDVGQAYRKGKVNFKTPSVIPEKTPASSIQYEDLPTPSDTTTTQIPPVPDAATLPSVPEMPSVTTDIPEIVEKAATGTSTSSSASSVNAESFIPSEISDSITETFAPFNNFLKMAQESTRATQQQTIKTSAPLEKMATTVDSAPPAKVPTLADYIGKSLADRKAELDVVTEKGASEFKLPQMKTPELNDINLPDMKIPDLKMPEFKGLPAGSFGSGISNGGMGVTPPEPGKALPLGDFLKATATGVVPVDPAIAVTSQSVLENAKIKLGIMIANFYNLIGKEPPDGLTLPDKLPDFSDFSLTDIIDQFKTLQAGLPEGAPLIAVALGTTLVVLGSRRGEDAKATASTEAGIQKTSAALGGLTGELETLQRRMKALEETGMNLNSQLQAAMEKLTEKELEISKERLKVADNALTLGRKIETLQQKLKENDSKVTILDKELEKTRDECEALQKQLEKAKAEQAAADAAKLTKKVATTKLADTTFFAKVVEPKSEPTKVVPDDPQPLENVSSKEKTREEQEDLPSASVGVTMPKKKVAPKKTIQRTTKAAAVEQEILPSASAIDAEDTPKKKVASKKAAVSKKSPAITGIEDLPSAVLEAEVVPERNGTKKAVEKKVPAKKVPDDGDGDLSTLSKSALSKKTVKELKEYLDSKGISTTGDDGKQLSKTRLVDAVLSL